jgi:hypothetical protein
MVSSIPIKKRCGGAIMLLHAGESLQEQIAEWGCLHPTVRIQLALSAVPTTVRTLMSDVVSIVIDATEHPDAATQTLESVLAIIQSVETELKLGVYTEKVHEGLELFVRRRGILFLLGPMVMAEWDGFFEGVVIE